MQPSTKLPRVLCVDDERRVLDGIRRHLRKDFDVTLAASASAALQAVRSQQPFEVVVSDLQMPGMDGTQLLCKLREISPTTVRILLTGNADVKTAVAAVNEGNLFRFLTKPCPADRLAETLRAGIEQHRLLTAEKVLLEKTLHGSIKMLTEVLALVDPAAFGRGARLKELAGELADALGLEKRWQLEVAAMLSQLGSVIVSGEVSAKLHRGEALTTDERKQLDSVPATTEQLVANIPRLEEVREALAYQNKYFDGRGVPEDGIKGEAIPAGARMLRLMLDYDALEDRHVPVDAIFEDLRKRQGCYDPVYLKALMKLRLEQDDADEAECIGVASLRVGMVFLSDCVSNTGRLLIARGQKITPSVLARIQNFAENEGIQQPLRMGWKINTDDEKDPDAAVVG